MSDPPLPDGLVPNEFVCQVLAAGGAFTPAECAQVLAGRRRAGDGAVIGTTDAAPVRRSAVSWLPRDPSTEWLYQRVNALLQQLNDRFWRAELADLEVLQLARYGVGDHYDWHIDLGPGRATLRKLSVSVQLSAPQSYDGGDLEFPDVVGPVTRAQGAAVVFPSYLRHRVTPITRGERWSLVGWFVGPPWR